MSILLDFTLNMKVKNNICLKNFDPYFDHYFYEKFSIIVL